MTLIRRIRLPQSAAQFWQTPTGMAALAIAAFVRMLTWVRRERTRQLREQLREVLR